MKNKYLKKILFICVSFVVVCIMTFTAYKLQDTSDDDSDEDILILPDETKKSRKRKKSYDGGNKKVVEENLKLDKRPKVIEIKEESNESRLETSVCNNASNTTYPNSISTKVTEWLEKTELKHVMENESYSKRCTLETREYRSTTSSDNGNIKNEPQLFRNKNNQRTKNDNQTIKNDLQRKKKFRRKSKTLKRPANITKQKELIEQIEPPKQKELFEQIEPSKQKELIEQIENCENSLKLIKNALNDLNGEKVEFDIGDSSGYDESNYKPYVKEIEKFCEFVYFGFKSAVEESIFPFDLYL